jgi:hypothetical protein
VCWGKKSPPPSASDAGLNPPGCTTAPCTAPPCPSVEIEINNTPATNDDLVALKCEHPARRASVNSRIRATGSPANDATIVLTNPDGRLRFPNVGDTTTTVTVPASGAWVPFQISGERGSAALNDAVIQAHCQTATGDIKGTKTVTVFWFDQVQINITTGGSYALGGGRFRAVGGNAVNYSAQARIRPAGVDCTAPQITNLRVGILQNGIAGVVGRITWDSPTIAWSGGVAAGTIVTVPREMRLTRTQPTTANDSAATVAPLYDQPGKADTLDANSLKPPLGCAGGAAATSNDSPGDVAPPTLVVPAQTVAGVNVGNITYRFKNSTIEGGFTTWVVTFDTSSNDFCALRQRGWTINVDTAGPAPQRASPAAADAAASSDPLTAAPFANTLVNVPANSVTAPVNPAVMTTFTK